MRDFATYHVGLKILLEKDGKILFLKTDSGKWDFPGGRIDDVETTAPLADILAREIAEELGQDLKYRLGKPVVHFRRYYSKIEQNIFLVVFEAEYVSGEVVISDEHESYEWINSKTVEFKKEDFMSEEEFEALVEYFKGK